MIRSQDSLVVTHRKVWSLAGPIILSNISVPLVGAVDTAVVGHLPEPQYIGAVALGASVMVGSLETGEESASASRKKGAN